MNGKTKQEQVLKAIRKEKRFVKKMTVKKKYNERIFAVKKLYESGMLFYNGTPIKNIENHERLSKIYMNVFGISLSKSYSDTVYNKTIIKKNDFVYFIGNREWGLVKIGYSKKPELRLKQVQTMAPFPVEILKIENGNKENENKYHLKFSSLNSYGEWFLIKSELMVHLHSL